MNPSRILIVEDEGLVARNIEDRLLNLGYQLGGHALSGEQALQLTLEQQPNLVLMDIHLKGAMDGIITATEIHRRFQVPVIFLTAHSEDEILERAKQANPSGYILKPFNDQDLKSAIEIALYKHDAEKEIRRLNRLYEVLSQVNQTIIRVQFREELLAQVCQILVERGLVDLAWIGWLDQDTGHIRPVAFLGSHSEILNQAQFYADDRPEGQGNPGRAIREGKPFVCNTCVAGTCLYPPGQALDRFGFQSCGSFPLRFQGQVCGVLNLSGAEPNFFGDREIRLLEKVALDISFGLDKIEGETQRQRLHDQIRHQAAFLDSLLDAMPLPVVYKDSECRYLGCNRAYEQCLGFKKAEMVGKTVHDLFPQEVAEPHHNIDLQLLQDQQPRIYEAPAHNARGELCEILSHKAIFRNPDGRVGGIIGAMEDITTRKRAESKLRQADAERRQIEAQLRQAKKIEAISILAGGIAHDFNNILMVIMGNAEMAELVLPADNKANKFLEQVLSASCRARDLIQQILTFSRWLETDKKPLELGPVIKEALRLVRASLPSTIEICQDLSSQQQVLADATQIHQIILNLATNACHAMQKNGGKLTVRLTDIMLITPLLTPHGELPPGSYVRLEVKDTGSGIEPDVLSRIFEPYFTLKDVGEGTGMGLATVLGIAKTHDGDILVDSEPGQGTTFVILFPALQASLVERQAETDKPLLQGTGRILFVDDEPALTDFSQEALNSLGYEVTVTNQSPAALEIFRANPAGFDLVITDLTMPKLTGVDLAQKLLEIRDNIPIILCTGYGDQFNRQEIVQLGIREFLPKPLGIRQLAEMVHQVLSPQTDI